MVTMQDLDLHVGPRHRDLHAATDRSVRDPPGRAQREPEMGIEARSRADRRRNGVGSVTTMPRVGAEPDHGARRSAEVDPDSLPR